MVQPVEELHECGNHRRGHRTWKVVGLDERPQGIEDVVGGAEVGVVGLRDYFACVTVERWGHSPRSEGHGETFEKGDAGEFEIIGKTFGRDNAAGGKEYSC